MYKSIIFRSLTFLLVSILTLYQLEGQYWQQEVSYMMDIDMEAEENRFNGTQQIVYKNNSPDTLHRIFYHLFFNAFQPGSMMDVRSLTISDPDRRVGSRISELSPEEMGFQRITSLDQDGQALQYEVVGTILEVDLARSIPPGGTDVFNMKFVSQVPLQIRRSGRDNAEGIRFSMSQWYPRLCEYDYMGWHANPYVGREFHGIWGDYDVKIHIDKDYVVAATGIPQVVEEEKKKKRGLLGRKKGKTKRTWHFKAENVIDFVWAADPDYKHTQIETEEGIELHFYYQENSKTKENWELLPEIMSEAMSYINEKFGMYPYERYSFIQGGDGGMEYPMATLITGERRIGSLVGVSVHELMHSWYQMVLASNESLYPWMDEGFTSFASNDVMNYLRKQKMIPGEVSEDPQQGSYTGYINFSQTGMEEPLSTHADHYMTNAAYGVGSYVKGAVFLAQLRYIMGEDVFWEALKDYYETWQFKHPDDIKFIRVMEKHSGLELDWYRQYMVNTTHTIDYAITNVRTDEKGHVIIDLEKKGVMPMPVDLIVESRDGGRKMYHIPLRIMRGAKTSWNVDFPVETLKDWPWTHRNYSFKLPLKLKNLKTIQLDPLNQMADINKDNNRYDHAE